MSKFFSICNKNNRNINSKSMSSNKKATTSCYDFNFYLTAFLTIAVVFLAVFYILRITSTSTSGFKVSDLESKMQAVKLVNQNLKEKVNNLDNPALLQEKANQAGLVAASNVEYMHLNSNDVAVVK